MICTVMGPKTQSPREVPIFPWETNTLILLPLKELPKVRKSTHLRVFVSEEPGARNSNRMAPHLPSDGSTLAEGCLCLSQPQIPAAAEEMGKAAPLFSYSAPGQL